MNASEYDSFSQNINDLLRDRLSMLCFAISNILNFNRNNSPWHLYLWVFTLPHSFSIRIHRLVNAWDNTWSKSVMQIQKTLRTPSIIRRLLLLSSTGISVLQPQQSSTARSSDTAWTTLLFKSILNNLSATWHSAVQYFLQGMYSSDYSFTSSGAMETTHVQIAPAARSVLPTPWCGFTIIRS